MPKVSIIVPTYNVEQYLREAMDSIINQTLKDIEIICIDDGSTDNSGKILDEYASKDSRVKVIHKKNGGYGKAMNVGLDNATGEYVGIVEPDDYIEPDMYENLYNKAIEQDVDIVKSDYYSFIGQDDDCKENLVKLINIPNYYGRILTPSVDDKILYVMTTNWSGIFKRSFLIENNIRHNETPGAAYQDNGFYIQTMYLAKRIYFMDIPFYHYRLDNPNQSIHKKNNTYTIPYEYKFIDEVFKNNRNLDTYRSVYFYRKYRAYMWHMKSRLDFKLWKEYLEYISVEFNEHEKHGDIDKKYFSVSDYNDLILIKDNIPEYLKKYETHNISVIIPVYNCERFLRKCLDSVIGQTLKDIEIICVDDCSTDNSLSILQEYAEKDDRIKLIALDKNLKQGGARNRALDVATGKYIMFVDSDDYISEYCCENLYKIMENNNCDIVISNIENVVESNDSTLQEHKEKFDLWYSSSSCDSGLHSYNFNTFKSLRSGPVAKLFKKSIIVNNDIKFPENRINEDEAFNWYYMINVKSIYVDNNVYYYRMIHENSTMFQRDVLKKDVLDQLYILLEIYNYLKTHKKLKKYKKTYNRYFYVVTQNVLNKVSRDASLRKDAKRIIKNLKFKCGQINILTSIFSVKNRGVHKVITLFGLKLKFRNKKKERLVAEHKEKENLRRTLNSLKQQNVRLQQQTLELQKVLQSEHRQIKEDFKKYINEVLYSQVMNDSSSEAKWLKKRDFSLTSGAANYSFIFILFKILEEINPSNILEFGLGQTGKLTTQYVVFKNQSAKLDIVEHNQDWIKEFSQKLDLVENVKIHHKNLIEFELNNVKSDKYESLNNITEDNKKFDLIIIDGPFGFDRVYPRTNILDLIPDNLADNFVIILDDAERSGEKNTAELIFNKLRECNISYKKSYKVGTKTQLIISSPDYEFIHWY